MQVCVTGQVWILKRVSDKEGAVELVSLHELPRMIGKAETPRQMIRLWELKGQETVQAAEAAHLLQGHTEQRSSLRRTSTAMRRTSTAMLAAHVLGVSGTPKVAPVASRQRHASLP